MALLAGNFLVLAVQVAGVLDADFHLLGHLGVGHAGPQGRYLHQLGVVQFRAFDQVQDAGFAAHGHAGGGCHFTPQGIGRGGPQPAQALAFGGHRILLGVERGPAGVINQAQLASGRGQAHIGVVLAQLQAVLGAAGEHAVGLAGAVGDQIIHQHAQVGLVTARVPALQPTHPAGGIDAGQQALCTGLFVTGGAVDLAGEEQAADQLGFQCVLQAARVEEVVFDGVAGAGDVGVFHAGDAAHQGQLGIERQRGGNAVGVDLHHIQAFGLDEDLVAVLLGKAHHLVLDRRAVARADAFDLARIQRRTVQRAADDVVGLLAGVGDPAADLARVVGAAAQVGHHRARVIAGLFLHHRIVERTAVDARRGAGLQAVDRKRALAQARGQGGGRRVAHAPGGVLGLADMDLAGQEGAGGQHHGRGMEAQPGLGDGATHRIAVDDQVIDRGLEHGEVGLRLDHLADRHAVQVAVGLAAGGTHGRALGGIERAPLDAGPVSGLGHRPAQGVDFLDQVALADATDGRVAAHRADGFHVVAEQQGAHTGARRGQGGFGAGMATADDDDVVMEERVTHGRAQTTWDRHFSARSRWAGRWLWHASCFVVCSTQPGHRATLGAKPDVEQGPATAQAGEAQGRQHP